MASAAPQDTPPWWAAFPDAQATCPRVEASEVAALLEETARAGPDAARTFLLVDVRRTDWEGGTVATSINLPAHTFYQTRPVIYQLCKQAGIRRIIIYCGSCGSRGPRCAGWMQDFLNQVGETGIKAEILAGGIKGWQKTYGGKWMDSYDEKTWAEQSR
ncbi:Rhodanese-like domain-containing protein [Dactylonectria estremocensis]|uniref:Rhodanese-like domain-containing protein n=1 Tax=Dactylonectria estremocensis TaxID=1079267 RepID=A0A9P9F7M7_9HYPO|nr:Rhodanese-like domain-containing protein [Dactylonectria estremocensis]